MTEQEIKDRIPNGATHYSESTIFNNYNYYFKIQCNDVYIWALGRRWRKTMRNFDEYSNLKPHQQN